MIEIDVEDKELPEDKLERVIALAERLSEQKRAKEEAEELAKEAGKAYRKTEREDLPMLMAELGVPMLKLPSGETVTIQEDCTASITEQNHPAAMRWLIKNGFGGLIKTGVTVEFGRGERDNAVEAAKTIAEAGFQPTVYETVHHSTLKSFVKEQLREGADVPFDLFSIEPFDKAVIKK